MTDLVSSFVKCASELYDAYKSGDWPAVIEHVGHILTHSAELWKHLNLKSDSGQIFSDEDDAQVTGVQGKLMDLQSELEMNAANEGYTTTAIDPHLLLVVVQLAIELIHILKSRS